MVSISFRKDGAAIVMSRKVLQVIYSLYRGGAERIIAAQILGTDRRSFEYFVCSLTGGGDLVDQMSNAGAHMFLLGKRRRGDAAVVTKLANLIRRERVDLLHLHNSPGMFWGTLAQIASRTGAPIVRTEHLPYRPEVLPPLFRWAYPRFTKRASRVICVSEQVRQSFAGRFPELAGKFITIPNGIRLQDYEALPPRAECRAQFNLPPDVKLIGTVGRMVPQKNHKLLIEALSLVRQTVPDVHLAIVGEGELRDSLAAYAADLGMSECVSLIKETQKIDCFYGAIDILALSSDIEGMPLTLLEALASLVPTVSTEVGGIPEIIEDGRTGLLVPKGSAQLLAKRIIELLQNPSRAAELASNGRRMAHERFSAEKMIKATEAVYEEVLAKAALKH